MDRRTVLKSLAASAGGLWLPGVLGAKETKYESDGPAWRFGWNENRASLEDFLRRTNNPYVSQVNQDIQGSGKGKKAFLHLALERVMGTKYIPHEQKAPDCVSHAAALGIDILTAVQIVLKRMPYRWVTKAASEPIYAGSRVEIGGYTGPGGGSTGHWAAEWVSRYGVLLRQEYPGGHDYTTYDAKKAITLGRTGCPDSLEPIAKLHPVKKTSICTSYDDLCDLIYNGSPVIVCSNVGFGSGRIVRDSQGFLTRKRKPWYHSMLFAAYDDEFERKGALCFNSWGCFDEQTEILTDQGWKHFKDLDRTEKVATLTKDHELEYQAPTQYHRYPYAGHLWHHKSRDIDFAVTPNHNLYFATLGSDKWKYAHADVCHKSIKFKKNAKNTNSDVKWYDVGGVQVEMDLWLEFLGYWLAEGSASEKQAWNKGRKWGLQRHVSVAQKKKHTRKVIWKCLQLLPFKFNKYPNAFLHRVKSPLVRELLPFGHAHEKYIPDYVWQCSERQLKILYAALMLGDGTQSKGPTGIKRTYYTSSKRLADDFQRLLLHCGLCGDISFTDRRGRQGGGPGSNITRHIEYRVGIKVKAFEQAVKYQPVLLPYEGEVHCVSVPNRTVYVRRNGRVVWMGNSDWVNGPTRGPQPGGTFWIDANTVDVMLRGGDSFAYSAYVGFPRVDLPPYVLY